MKGMIFNITFNSEPAYLPIIRSMVRGISSHNIENEGLIEDIELSVHEALTNVMCHAYENEPNHQVSLSVGWSNEDITFEIRDTGHASLVPFAPPPVDESTILDIESLLECGRGLFFIYQLMDEISYTSERGENTLLLRKHFS